MTTIRRSASSEYPWVCGSWKSAMRSGSTSAMGYSDGMRREIAHARLLGKRIVEIREVRLCASI